MDLYRSVVISGGRGMLAAELIAVLRARGVEPLAIDRDICDITDKAAVGRLFAAQRPSLLLNCAAHTGVDLCEDEPQRANLINGEGVANLAEFSREHSTKLIHFSTDFVFDGQSDRPYRPDDRPAPISAYGRSKLLGEEKLAQISPPSWLIVRTAWLFGRHGNCFPQIIVGRARGGHSLKVVDDQQGSPTHAGDLARGVFDLVDKNASGIWHLTNSGTCSWYQFAQAIVTEFSIPAEVAPISTAGWRALRPKQANRPAYSVLDIEPFECLTGRKMRHWRDALRDYRTEVEKNS